MVKICPVLSIQLQSLRGQTVFPPRSIPILSKLLLRHIRNGIFQILASPCGEDQSCLQMTKICGMRSKDD